MSLDKHGKGEKSERPRKFWHEGIGGGGAVLHIVDNT